MVLTYRTSKDSPLTHQELDNNFKDLDSRLKEIENTVTALPMTKVLQKSDELLFLGEGEEMIGRLKLPTFFDLPLFKQDTLPVPSQGRFIAVQNQDEMSLAFSDGKAWWKIQGAKI